MRELIISKLKQIEKDYAGEELLVVAKVAIGGGSSSLVKARYCGLKCFNIIDQKDRKRNTNAGIEFVMWNEIEGIILDDNDNFFIEEYFDSKINFFNVFIIG